MIIRNVKEIYDSGESGFVTIITLSGSAIHLPINAQHSITIHDMENPSDEYHIHVNVDLYAE